MPVPAEATATREGDTLRVAGALLRDAIASLWRRMPPLAGVRTLDLAGVSAIDSAGLALLSEAGARCGAPPALVFGASGAPDGFDELRNAYRLDPHLQFQAT